MVTQIQTPSFANKQPAAGKAIVRGSGEFARRYHALMMQRLPTAHAEQRKSERIPLPQLLTLTPIDDHAKPKPLEQTVVVGKDISAAGLGFFHQHPLTCRRALVAFDDDRLGALVVELDLAWCRFRKQGWYESGGRVVRVVDSVATTTRVS